MGPGFLTKLFRWARRGSERSPSVAHDAVIPLDFARERNQRVVVVGHEVQVGNRRLGPESVLDCGAPIGQVRTRDLAEEATRYAEMTGGTCVPQLAALVFLLSGQPAALDGYFPLTRVLEAGEKARFYEWLQEIIAHPGFDLRLFDEHGDADVHEMPPDVAHLVAGHLAEIFFYRRDILERLLSTPRHIWIYATPAAFARGGGVAGGCYNPSFESVQLVLSRLYEGFDGPAPGVAPFLHEFGHMLDHFDAAQACMGMSTGFLPGMRPQDGAIYTPSAREHFVGGKRVEIGRYLRYHHGTAIASDPIPIGHPYVFQNDSEFVAGYLEMFFRNPHYFAARNTDLYLGFAGLLRQDPRHAWEEDFPFYVQENQKAYRRVRRGGGFQG